MLFSQRKRQAELMRRMRAGENLWVDEFDERFRNQLIFAMFECSDYPEVYLEASQYALVKTYGKPYLANPNARRAQDFLSFVMTSTSNEIADCIEVFIEKLDDRNLSSRTHHYSGSSNFEIEIREKLIDNLIAYDLIDGKIVQRGEQKLYVDVIEPVLEYLTTQSRFTPTRKAFLEGLDQIKQKNAPNAITDFATAISEMLRALGASGTVLSALNASARSLKLLSEHDRKLIDWIASERNSGEAHTISDSTIDDAWLHAHVTAALILRLSKTTPRP